MTGSPAGDPLALAFRPLHKRAMGTGIGVAAAIATFLLTAIPLLRGRADELQLFLLSEYFRGYSATWQGAFIGAAWAAFVGFVIGWFLAFCCNVALAIRILTLRARADYAQTRDFLDHI